MTDADHTRNTASPDIERGVLVGSSVGGQEAMVETVSEPAKVMRIGSMVKQLLE